MIKRTIKWWKDDKMTVKKQITGLVAILILCFGFLLAPAVSIFYPQPYLYLGFVYKFYLLDITKEEIKTSNIGSTSVSFYSELDEEGRMVQILNFASVDSVVERAFQDFPVFVSQRYGIDLPELEGGFLQINFVSEDTFGYYENKRGEAAGAVTFLSKSKIYIKCRDFKFNITASENTIRHEVFHYLTSRYEWEILPHQDAAIFGSARNIRKAS